MAHARECYPRESCGIVVAGEYLAMENVAENPEQDFRISEEALLPHLDAMECVIHSHPGGPGYPSKADMEGQVASAVPWGIIVVNEDQVVPPFFFGDGLPVPELIGREFQHGVTDCYAIIRDWYKLERGVTLREFPRDAAWWDAGENLYLEGFRLAGFREIDQDDVQPGDVFLARIRSDVPNHGGVYVGDSLILHHLPNRLSRREPFGLWQRAVTHWLRYDGENTSEVPHAA